MIIETKKVEKSKYPARNVESSYGVVSVPIYGDRYVIPASNLEFG
ncbi:hypothetical protein [Methanocaldococcus vulcanius]|nr:hypothetical protein [Methanocaldococcus vulcanius]